MPQKPFKEPRQQRKAGRSLETKMSIVTSPGQRTTVRIPTSSGDAIEAWVYVPEGSGPHPVVVMAHGIGGIKAGGLAPFAERFREEGFVAIAFDYRNFGGSGGEPPQLLSLPRPPAGYNTLLRRGV